MGRFGVRVLATVLLCGGSWVAGQDLGSGSASGDEDLTTRASIFTTSGGIPTETPSQEYEPSTPVKPVYVDEFTGHELCFSLDANCPERACPEPTNNCALLGMFDPKVPLVIDLSGQCCPATCYGLDIDTGEPCMSTDKLPDQEDEPDYELPEDLDMVTGRKICYEHDPSCQAVESCPPTPVGCTSLAALNSTHDLLEVDPESHQCCPLPCATKNDENGKLCSWIETAGDQIVVGDGSVDFVDSDTGGKLCFAASVGCPVVTCPVVPAGCLALPDEDAPYEKVNDTSRCCKMACISVDTHGMKCGPDGPLSNNVTGGDVPADLEPGTDVDLTLCFDESESCPAKVCPVDARRRRREEGSLGFGCYYVDAAKQPLVLQSDGMCCKLSCIAVDVDGKPCADNMENVDEKVNDTQVDVCFDASTDCEPATCGKAPHGCAFLSAEQAPLVKMIDGMCCPAPCIAINSTTNGKCSKTENLPYIDEPADETEGDIFVTVNEIRLCSVVDALCPAMPSACPKAPGDCHNINATNLVHNADEKCCPLGCVAVDEHSKQCKVGRREGIACTVPGDICPFARCMEEAGCVLDANPPLVYNFEGVCCPDRICSYVQDTTSSEHCADDPALHPEISTINPADNTRTTLKPKINESDAHSNTDNDDGKGKPAILAMSVVIGIVFVIGLVAMACFAMGCATNDKKRYNQKLTNDLVGSEEFPSEAAQLNPVYDMASLSGKEAAQRTPVYDMASLAPRARVGSPCEDVVVFQMSPNRRGLPSQDSVA